MQSFALLAIIRPERTLTVQDIDAFRSQLDGDTLMMIDRLRAIVAASYPSLAERIKWNAPSFALGETDRITLGVERKGGVRLVLHRGAKAQAADSFSFDDIDGLAKWPASDRGVIVWKDVAAINRTERQLSQLCIRWIEHVGEGV